MKTCTKCKIEKNESEFYFVKGYKDGLNSRCKECLKVYGRNYYAIPEVKEKINTHNASPEGKAAKKLYDDTPGRKEAKKASNKTYNSSPKAKINKKAYKLTPEGRESTRIYENKRYIIDPEFKLSKNLRSRLLGALKGGVRCGSAVKDLGASLDFVRQHIESLFYGNMAWDNWGTYWELDHIKSLACFDLTDRDQLLQACHFSNLQPLTVKDHRLKTNLQEWRELP